MRSPRHWTDPVLVSPTSFAVTLTNKEQVSLNAAVDRVEAGHSAFELDFYPPRRPHRGTRRAAISMIYGHVRYPLYTRTIDHTPG